MPEPAIRVVDLVKRYRRRGAPAHTAVDGLSFDVRRGAIFGLLGPNGAGKTTTIKMLSTLVRPTLGRAEVLGFDVVREGLAVRRCLAVVIQEAAAEMFLSVRDNLLTYARFHGLDARDARRRADRLLADFQLTGDAERKAMDLSGGQRRRVQVAKAFLVDTPVVCMDEFSTGMDPILKRTVIEMLRAEAARGRTILLTTQVLSEAEALCDDILIVNRGREVARGDLHALKLLSNGIKTVTLTFERLPDGLEAELHGLGARHLRIVGSTVELGLALPEAEVLALMSRVAARGTVLRVEVAGASLEDVFVELLAR